MENENIHQDFNYQVQWKGQTYMDINYLLKWNAAVWEHQLDYYPHLPSVPHHWGTWICNTRMVIIYIPEEISLLITKVVRLKVQEPNIAGRKGFERSLPDFQMSREQRMNLIGWTSLGMSGQVEVHFHTEWKGKENDVPSRNSKCSTELPVGSAKSDVFLCPLESSFPCSLWSQTILSFHLP